MVFEREILWGWQVSYPFLYLFVGHCNFYGVLGWMRALRR
jgi:hypothetical protein